jgi:hypothetical protein
MKKTINAFRIDRGRDYCLPVLSAGGKESHRDSEDRGSFTKIPIPISITFVVKLGVISPQKKTHSEKDPYKNISHLSVIISANRVLNSDMGW